MHPMLTNSSAQTTMTSDLLTLRLPIVQVKQPTTSDIPVLSLQVLAAISIMNKVSDWTVKMSSTP